MSIIPDLDLTVASGGWFALVFLGTTFAFTRVGNGFAPKVLIRPPSGNLLERAAAVAGLILFQGSIALSFFIPLSGNAMQLAIGSAVFMAGLSLYAAGIGAMVAAPDDAPVTTGVYRISRNPQQIFSIVCWTGAGIAMGTALFALIGLARFAAAYPTFLSQERYCLARYGDAYAEYMRTVRRFMGRVRSAR